MPKEYITRQVIDPKQCNVVLTDETNTKLFAACCYRPVFDINFIEIIYYAVNADIHISGYGFFMMNILKECVKFQY